MNILTTSVALLLLGTPFAIHASAAPTTAPASVPTIVRSDTNRGAISAWQIQADGSVLFQLEGSKGQTKFALWFKTPANRTATTRLESLILDAVLALRGSSQPVTVISDSSNSESGESPKDAIPILSMGTR